MPTLYNKIDMTCDNTLLDNPLTVDALHQVSPQQTCCTWAQLATLSPLVSCYNLRLMSMSWRIRLQMLKASFLVCRHHPGAQGALLTRGFCSLRGILPGLLQQLCCVLML